MDEVINKPDDQFEGTLIDLIDYNKDTSEKEALLKLVKKEYEVNHIKQAASINSSTYSSAASSSSSSASSTNSTSSTSSTLSSPSQSNQTTTSKHQDQEIEMAIFEDQRRRATIVENSRTAHRYMKDFVGSSPFIKSASNNLTSYKNSTSRKRRLIEQPVLSQNIPGHKGEQAVDWLVNYIENRTSNQQQQQTNRKNNTNSTNTTNKRSKLKRTNNKKIAPPTNNENDTTTSTTTTTSSSTTTTTNNQNKIDRENGENNQGGNNELEEAVIFADHIKLCDDDETAQYTFGFFDSETSRRRYEYKDNVDTNSFDYPKIVKYFSNAWEQAKAFKPTLVS